MTSEKTTQEQHINGDPFSRLSDLQWRFITALIDNPEFSKKDAAELIGIMPQTTYRWPKFVDEALALAREDMHMAALTVRKNALLKAMRVKLALLNSADEKVRNSAATDIIEWELGKANQPLTGKGGGAIEVKWANDFDGDASETA